MESKYHPTQNKSSSCRLKPKLPLGNLVRDTVTGETSTCPESTPIYQTYVPHAKGPQMTLSSPLQAPWNQLTVLGL